MSLLLIISLLLEVAAVFVVVAAAGRSWSSHCGTLFIILAFIFHGLTELVQILFPGWNNYRLLIDQEIIDMWVATIGLSMFVFALIYFFSLRHFRSKTGSIEEKRRLYTGKLIPDWRILLVLTIPVYLAAIAGKQDTLSYWMPGLSEQFLIFGVTLSSISFILSNRRIFIVPVAIIQCILISLVASRLYVFVSVIILLTTLMRFRVNIKWRRILIISACVIFIALAIAAARVEVGRDILQEGNANERASGLIAGVSALTNAEISSDSMLDDFVYRFDGNSYGALIKESTDNGIPYAGLEPLWNNFTLVVPSFINPNKLSSIDNERSEKLFMDIHYKLPSGIDFIPTTLGIFYGYYGPLFLIGALVALGLLFAKIDNWMQQSPSVLSLLVGVGLTYCIILMEQGVIVYFIAFRGILTIYILFLFILFMQLMFKSTIDKRPSLSLMADARRKIF